jgi:hypothetical protein
LLKSVTPIAAWLTVEDVRVGDAAGRRELEFTTAVKVKLEPLSRWYRR